MSTTHIHQPWTTPRVIELPRRLESTSTDSFLDKAGTDAPLATVLQLRPRAGQRAKRSSRSRRNGPALHLVAGPGDAAA
jgi:hypothetical protein